MGRSSTIASGSIDLRKQSHAGHPGARDETREIDMSSGDLETTVDKFIFRVRVGYLYDEAGVWVDYDPARHVARLGLTDFRQQSSGDAAFVELPQPGSHVGAGDDVVNIETIKVDLVVSAPLDGEVVAINEALEDAPELVNQQPYDGGWLVELRPAQWPAAGLLDARQYLAVMQAQAEGEAK
jgi:glycine cleavage system H protein